MSADSRRQYAQVKYNCAPNSRTRSLLMSKSRTLAAIFCCLALACQIPASAQPTADPDINKKIRQEETDHSQIMHTMHFLTDVYGPRLTGSPNHKAAADWAIQQMTSWGFENAH